MPTIVNWTIQHLFGITLSLVWNSKRCKKMITHLTKTTELAGHPVNFNNLNVVVSNRAVNFNVIHLR